MDDVLVPLARCRTELYHHVFGSRRDALMDLLDALLSAVSPPPSTVRLSLLPAFRRRWPSVFDALSEGTVDSRAWRRVVGQTLPPPPADGRLVWALDGSTWPRPQAATSPDRTWGRFVTAGTPQSGIIAAWEDQWLVALPEPTGSWVLPLDVARRELAAGTPTQLALTQLRRVFALRPPEAPRPVVVGDSGYDVPTLVQAKLAVDWLARLAANRRFYRAPPPYAGMGRPRVHGPVFRCSAPATQGDPSDAQVYADDAYGQVTLTVWERLHAPATPAVDLTVVRVTVAHLPRRATPPAPLWLVWHGGPWPADLRTVWHWYQRRFQIEHGFRFCKQTRGWTTPHLRDPTAADRWTLLVASVLWHLWLARPAVAAARLPWEHAAPAGRLSPGRVRRALAGLVLALGTPARAPRPRGKSPGRQRGQCPGRAKRSPVQRRAPPAVA